MVQRYLITEVQKVYESQGIGINDKHFEVIIRKMSDKVIVESVGDTSLIPGDFVTKARFEEINAEVFQKVENQQQDDKYSWYYQISSVLRFMAFSCFLPRNNQSTYRSCT